MKILNSLGYFETAGINIASILIVRKKITINAVFKRALINTRIQ
jgi:hypothetical protein